MIYTISVLCCFLGFFMLYNTSKKAKLSTKGLFENWLQLNKPTAKAVGISLIALPFVILPVKDGAGVGTLTAILLLMTAAGLIIVIAPFHYVRFKHVAVLTVAGLLLEFLFF